jgi:hypothetical protein
VPLAPSAASQPVGAVNRVSPGPPTSMWKVSSRLILSPVKVKILVKTKATRPAS